MEIMTLLTQYSAAAQAFLGAQGASVPVLTTAVSPFIAKAALVAIAAAGAVTALFALKYIASKAYAYISTKKDHLEEDVEPVAQSTKGIFASIGAWAIAMGTRFSKSMFFRNYIRTNIEEDDKAWDSLLDLVDSKKSNEGSVWLRDPAIQPPLSFRKVEGLDGAKIENRHNSLKVTVTKNKVTSV